MEYFKIRKRCISDLTVNNHINTLNAIVKFFSSVTLDTFVNKGVGRKLFMRANKNRASINN